MGISFQLNDALGANMFREWFANFNKRDFESKNKEHCGRMLKTILIEQRQFT